jgi:hypothetical protein
VLAFILRRRIRRDRHRRSSSAVQSQTSENLQGSFLLIRLTTTIRARFHLETPDPSRSPSPVIFGHPEPNLRKSTGFLSFNPICSIHTCPLSPRHTLAVLIVGHPRRWIAQFGNMDGTTPYESAPRIKTMVVLRNLLPLAGCFDGD